ncbi:MAG: UDP-N-acetylmuramoyl-L-alanyl-D-glutamate--2,6-diaminopimelate ligase [Thermodesulfobacteriota bacterium]
MAMQRVESERATTVSLRELMAEIGIREGMAVPETRIEAITADSRQAGPGALFVAIAGQTVDGHAYVRAAVEQGCAAVLVGAGRCRGWKNVTVPCLEAEDTREALGRLAAGFYGRPAERMTMVGITGTNGKTTTTYLLEAMIRKAGGNPGVIGTVNYRYNQVVKAAPFTTPDPVTLHRILAEMAEGGVTHVVMETSSHALEQRRLAGVRFDVALFTNLSRDHLDFHGTMEEYFASKQRLFRDHLKDAGRVVAICTADPDGNDWGRRVLDGLAPEVASRAIACGGGQEQVAVERSAESIDGTCATLRTPVGEIALHSRLVGGFNLRNLLGAVGVGLALGIDAGTIGQGLNEAPAAPGRLEKVTTAASPDVFVDYAHTPDALENVLTTLRQLTRGRLIVIFGCGGDRDRGKRPLMGKVAGELADVVVLTSDNPRSEEPAAILAQIEEGVRQAGLPRMRLEAVINRPGLRGYDVIVSRREAIREVMRNSGRHDVVAICGKGHEDYQIIGTRKTFFDDRLEAALSGASIGW